MARAARNLLIPHSNNETRVARFDYLTIGAVVAGVTVIGAVAYLALRGRGGGGGCAPEDSRRCDASTKTWWQCTDGVWVDTSESCASSGFISSLRFTVHYEGTTTPAEGVQLTFGSLGAKLTDSLGQATFYNIPKDLYQLWVKKDGFHLREYNYHTPFADYIDVDLRTTVGTGDYDFPTTRLVPIIPDVRYSYFTITPPNVVGSSTQFPHCEPYAGACCVHQDVQCEFVAKDAWQEPISGLHVIFSQVDGANVCFTCLANPNNVDEWDLLVPTRDIQCSPKLIAAGFQMTKTDEYGSAKAFIRSNNNNTFTQRVKCEGRYIHPVTGAAALIEPADAYFGFTKCTYAQRTCYEQNLDTNNSSCP